MVIEEAATQDFPCQHIPSQAVEGDLGEAKRLRKAAKKERRKAVREIKKAEFKADKAVMAVDNEIGDQTPVVDPFPESTSIEQKAADEEPAKKRKKSKLGPTTSAYFVKAQIPTLNSPTGPSVIDDNDSKTSHANERAMKQERAAARMEAGSDSVASIIAPLKAGGLVEQTRPVVGDAASKPPNKPVSVAQEVKSTQTSFDHTHKLGEHVSEVTDEKHKRKRKRERNHNRLPEESRGAVNIQETAADSLRHEAVKLHAEKRSRTEAFVENLPMASDDDKPEKTSKAREKDGENFETKLKRKKRRRRKQHAQDEPAVLEESYVTLPNPDETEIVIDDHNAETTKQPVDSGTVKEHEGSEPLTKSRRERGRKSKGKHREDTKSGKGGHATPPEEQTIVEPLTELANANAKSPKQGRQHRGRARKRESVEYSEMQGDHQSSREQSKARHS